jgi:putative DNA methylase
VIPKACKRLAEVDFPIREVSKHAAREKSIRHGHPSTLHLWWARRPLASCRAVLLSLLWPDPCDLLCPVAFKTEARRRLPEVPGCDPGKADEDLRHALLRFIADFANWDNATNRTYLDVARALIKAAHRSAEGADYQLPLVVDPFAGGGSIPLEALRLECDSFASDTNPVAALILKTTLEAIPSGGGGLASRIRTLGSEIEQHITRDLGEFYPTDPHGAKPVAYLWARTVRCEAPKCGVEFPLARSFWLSKPRGGVGVRLIRPKTHVTGPLVPEVFSPRTRSEVSPGTVAQGKATCPICRATLSPNRVKAQLRGTNGGAHVVFDSSGRRTGGAMLLAVVTRSSAANDAKGYRSPTARDYENVWRATQELDSSYASDLPTEPLPYPPNVEGAKTKANYSFMPIRLYGLRGWIDMFAKRQQLALVSLCHRIGAIPDLAERRVMAMVLGRCVDYWSASAMWANEGEFVAHTFGRQALPMVWDFAEAVPIGNGSGSLANSVDWVARVIERLAVVSSPGQSEWADATRHPLPDDSAAIWFTDPPYYDSVPYSYLSDFFLVWHKRALGDDLLVGGKLAPDGLTDRRAEIISELEMLRGVEKSTANSLGFDLKDHRSFEQMMAAAFREGARVINREGIGSVVFAHKTTEGWEALLSGLIDGGWVITGSWPIATERPGRLRAKDSAALATSVHLICRPRPDDASVGDWAEVLRELPNRVGDWMERLQRETVRGADLVFACIGPALEIFSRYIKVETADGREVTLGEYLEKVWEVVGRSALAQILGTAEAKARNGGAAALEEDARLTALFLWTIQSTAIEGADDAEDEDEPEAADGDDDEADSSSKAKGFTLVFDVVRRFAQPLGIELPKWEGRVIEIKKGVVRLLPIAERAKQLFGEDGTKAVAARLEREAATLNPLQGMLFPDRHSDARKVGGRGGRKRAKEAAPGETLAGTREATTLDRVHAAMLLQAGGRTNALRTLLKAEQERSPDFLRLANALSALYPKGSEEKRLLDAMLLAVPR